KEAEDAGRQFYVVVPDDGAENLVETLAVDSDVSYNHIINILKDRPDAGDVEIKGFKDFVHPESLEGAVCAIADDMTSSGGTQEEIAKYLKNNYNISRAIGIVSHAVCPDSGPIESVKYVDEFIALDTVPQKISNVRFLEGSAAAILASSVLRSYRRAMAGTGDSLPVINGNS
ncbi:MAG: hypothetical protein KKE20_01485, partial [Nanoarchaeota archaeon]|nr:hypothetical protein [Nanoarchaeota archaeon]